MCVDNPLGTTSDICVILHLTTEWLVCLTKWVCILYVNVMVRVRQSEFGVERLTFSCFLDACGFRECVVKWCCVGVNSRGEPQPRRQMCAGIGVCSLRSWPMTRSSPVHVGAHGEILHVTKPPAPPKHIQGQTNRILGLPGRGLRPCAHIYACLCNTWHWYQCSVEVKHLTGELSSRVQVTPL